MPLRSWLRRRVGRRAGETARRPVGSAGPTPPVPRSAASRPPPSLRERPLADPSLALFDPAVLREDCTPRIVHPGLFSVPLLRAEAAERLQRELAAAAAWCDRQGVVPPPPNSMHEAGMMLSLLGLDGWARGLAQEVLAPLAARCFPDHTAGPPPELHAFSVDYGPAGDRELAQHVDDAVVTANLWLGGDAEDSAVVFEGVRCLAHLDLDPSPDEVFAWRGQPGEVLLHAGLHRHRTRPVGRGQRSSLIFWLQDPRLRERMFARAEEGRCGPGCPGDSMAGA